jgi:peptidyl-dipeptidase Dcp
MNLLAKIAAPAVAKVKSRKKVKFNRWTNGGFKLEPRDWNFTQSKYVKLMHDLDESQVKPYFELTTVLEKEFSLLLKKNVWYHF